MITTEIKTFSSFSDSAREDRLPRPIVILRIRLFGFCTPITLDLDKIERCRRKFLRFFPRGFEDPKYFACERGYKSQAHQQWNEVLNQADFKKLLKNGSYVEIASAATRIESKTNLLFSFEKMAFRDAVRDIGGARIFSEALFELLYGRGSEALKFDRWCDAIEQLPRTDPRADTPDRLADSAAPCRA